MGAIADQVIEKMFDDETNSIGAFRLDIETRYWVTKEGVYILITDMKHSHLQNAYALCVRRGLGDTPQARALCREIERRGCDGVTDMHPDDMA